MDQPPRPLPVHRTKTPRTFKAWDTEPRDLSVKCHDPTLGVNLISADTLGTIALSFGLLPVSLKSVPFGTAYAIRTGIGAAGTVTVGIFMFGEPAEAARPLCLALIVTGIA